MSHLSRREFLKSSGIAVLAGTVGRLSLMLPSAPQIDALYGRALSVLTVYDSPSPSAVVINRLFPDSVVPIIDTLSDWYQLANGYAKRSDIQPMMLTNHTVPTPQLPFWAEVGGAVAIVRGWCAADAPLVARIGHGGVAQVVDMLPGEQHTWYALADEDTFLGWSSASAWIPVEAAPFEMDSVQLHIDIATREIQFLENHQPVMRAPIMLGRGLAAGNYAVHRHKRSVKYSLDDASKGYGVPWRIDFGEYSLAGAYWHNDFGTDKILPGPDVQVAPAVARWLYERLPENSLVVVR